MSATKPKRKTCSFCRDPAVLHANDKRGNVLAFCNDCLLILVTKAIDVWGDKLRDIL
jgi:hypothetical protein